MATNEPSSALRLTFLTVIVIVMFVALFSRLWFLQVLAGDRYAELAETNRVRIVVTEAPRGNILAAGGEDLVKNRPALTISAERQRLLDDAGNPRDEEAERTLQRLSTLLEMEIDEIVERLTSRRYSPFRPIPIAFDVAPEIVFSVREQQELFPGVIGETLPVRTYPEGELAAHMVGYLGEISEDELTSEEFSDHRAGDLVGRGGLEQVYEQDLRGRYGEKRYEVNAQNTVLDVISEREPVQGNDLRTSIDLELQEATERLLREGIEASRNETHQASGRSLPSTAGSAIVLDPNDGSVLAMASFPTYDPREFVGGVGPEYWEEINDRENHTPLVNRPIAGTYPPGSVFKVVSGAAILKAGASPSTTVQCAPSYDVGGQTFRNWNRGVHEGPMTLADALRRSCDTYFYELFFQQWQREQAAGGADAEVLPDVARAFGHGRQLGIDLPGESVGVIPGREWKQQYWEQTRETNCALAQEQEDGTYAQRLYTELCESGNVWRGGDAVNTSIGQGDVLVTPMQVAAAYMGIANGGTVYAPRVADAIVGPDGEVVREIGREAISELGLDEPELASIRRGLDEVVMHQRGTAYGAFRDFPLGEIPVAGKTGTAEMQPRVPFAWFAAYAPADDPEVVVVVNVEEGGGGSQTATPIARNILEAHFGLADVEDVEFEVGPEFND
jgi:penicillin-binding protein 2